MDENREQSHGNFNKRTSRNDSSKFELKKNCYEFSIELNQSDRTEASKCIDIAQAALQESKYDKAERFLLKSLRICESETAKLLLETVRNAQNNTNGDVKTEEYNELIINPNVEMNKYNIYRKRATEAIAEGNLPKAERFLSKAIQINPNDDAQKQLKHIQELKVAQASNDETITPKKKVVRFATDIKTGDDAIDKAHSYGERELQTQQNEEMTEQMNELNLKTSEEVNQFVNFKLDEGEHDKELTEKTYPTESSKDSKQQLNEKLKSGGNMNDLMAELKKKIAKRDSSVSQPESKIKEGPSEYISEIQRVENANNDFGILGELTNGSDCTYSINSLNYFSLDRNHR